MKQKQLPALIVMGISTLAAFALSGCIQVDTTPTPTPSPLAATSTPTVFFPTLIPTPTFTPIPTGSPTPDLLAGLGDLVFIDDFSQDQDWTKTQLAPGGVSLVDERMTLSVRQANGLYMVLSPADPLENAYLQVDVRPELCSENDEFGLVYRVNDSFEHYRFTLTCDGQARVVGVIEGSERVLVPNSTSPAIFPGLFLTNRLGILITGDTFRFFINDEEVFSDRDLGLANGWFGLVVRARQSGQTTASFDNFILRALQPSPTSSNAD